MQFTNYLESVVKPLLSHPDYLTIMESQDTLGILLTLEVHKDDMGLVVGKEGAMAKSLRHLIRGVGMRSGARVSIKINEPKG